MNINDQKKKKNRKVGTFEMSLVRNSSTDVYPAHHGVTWGVTSPSTSIYGHSLKKKSPHFIFIYFF